MKNPENVKEMRLKHRLSQQDLADMTGIPKGRINGWEQGKGKPKAEDAQVLEKFFSGLEKESFHVKPTRETVDSPKIPFYDVIAVGGSSIMLHDQEAVSGVSEMIDPGTFLRAATGALRVYGHSMYPKYPAGCIVAFKASSKPIPEVIVWGEDYVIELERFTG